MNIFWDRRALFVHLSHTDFVGLQDKALPLMAKGLRSFPMAITSNYLTSVH